MALEVPYAQYTSQNGEKTYDLFRREAHVYIVDHIFDDPDHNVALREHRNKCEQVRRFFRRRTNCQVHLTRVRPGETEDTFTDYWTNQLQGKGVGDLVILYYHGKAGSKGTNYTWRFCGGNEFVINAHDLIQKIHDTKADCMLLLDCYVPTRFPDEWDIDDANIEIIGRGQRAQDDNENIILDEGDFTNAMVSSMTEFVKAVNSGQYQGDAPRSIPHIMAKNEHIASNPLRVWHKKPNPRLPNTIIKRIQIRPLGITMTGLMQFMATQIQPYQRNVNAGANAGNPMVAQPAPQPLNQPVIQPAAPPVIPPVLPPVVQPAVQPAVPPPVQPALLPGAGQIEAGEDEGYDEGDDEGDGEESEEGKSDGTGEDNSGDLFMEE